MASIDGMVISQAATVPAAGGAFHVHRAADRSGAFDVGDGWVIEIRGGSRLLVARGGNQDSYTDAVAAALDYAQRGLDVLSMRGLGDHSLVAVGEEQLVWWIEQDQVALRMLGVAHATATVPPISVVVRDASGGLVPNPPVKFVWHPSFRYFRRSQLTDDLVEAYRECWLAVEALLDSIVPRGKGSESAWLKDALRAADATVPLGTFLPAGMSGDPVEDAYKYFYDDRRKPIFHSKPSRSPTLPYESAARDSLASAHKHLVRLFLELADRHLQARRAHSGVTAYAFEAIVADAVAKGASIQLTNDPAPFDPSQTTVNPGGGEVVALEARRVPALERPFLAVFFGSAPGSDLGGLDCVTWAGLVSGGRPVAAYVPDGRLTLDGLTRFQVQAGLRLYNSGQPKERYLT